MSDADFPNPPLDERVILAGDTKDDDAEVFASDFQEGNPWGLSPQELPQGPAQVMHAPRPLTRLITLFFPARVSHHAIQILSPDPDRVSLTLIISAPATNPSTYIRVSDDPGKVQMDQGALCLPTGTVVQRIEHTGPVYASVPVGDGLQDYGMNISVMAVTR